VPEHGHDAVLVELCGEGIGVGNPLGGYQASLRDGLPEELARGECIPVGEPALRQGSADLTAVVEDVAVRVAERARLDPELGVRYESSLFRMPRKPRNRRQ
jgi:hypothetical protein